MRCSPNYILTGLTLCQIVGCKGESPEAKIRQAFDTCVKAVEGGDVGGATEVLHKDFLGPEGLNKAGVKLYLMGLLRQEKVGITVFGNRVEVKGAEAHQYVELMLTSKGDGLLPQDATHRTFHLRWRLEGGEWRLRQFEEGV